MRHGMAGWVAAGCPGMVLAALGIPDYCPSIAWGCCTYVMRAVCSLRDRVGCPGGGEVHTRDLPGAALACCAPAVPVLAKSEHCSKYSQHENGWRSEIAGTANFSLPLSLLWEHVSSVTGAGAALIPTRCVHHVLVNPCDCSQPRRPHTYLFIFSCSTLSIALWILLLLLRI